MGNRRYSSISTGKITTIVIIIVIVVVIIIIVSSNIRTSCKGNNY